MSSPHAAAPLTLALLHLRTNRPHAPHFQEKLDALNAATTAVAGSLGWRVTAVASAEVEVDETLAAVDRADAVVLMGGEDVHPSFYEGATEYPGSGVHEPAADRAHIAAVRRCLTSGTPVLGICRGLQVLNVALGGALVPHLETGHTHRAEGDDPFVRNRVALADDTLASSVDVSEDVRCSHHQAVDRLGDGLRVAAYGVDGVVEAVVHDSAPITGIQWHPEHPAVAERQLAPLLRRLAEQAGVPQRPGQEYSASTARAASATTTSSYSASGSLVDVNTAR
ncbi:gamma-glutamyl-gamma-aminobutyrate hydrolase family protein [Aeromicrobium duanguangcaii]|uniref:Gamma-glutamyl-gamma-aminobutyrate hydrolase family protein n=1 Tax=Aeromicrobium duanguangcaii TaxID=2968086 RepID=A0ABY5KLP1_9ACTN|nr:gamma-glutamyl-gamma-aminobutyrate hydrolase family protein [Aeromicrobium duanguangcaii]MCD9152898.1 gamma-glutamyl-gamma-aminobutyrate hydrolase family protein [Aeromicrobium duanguangcaii]UUI69996.1 gamma-glutamyl-gamma-aminobutyrate hydrolase family protein [Aeromicrobium duanguangcaii]